MLSLAGHNVPLEPTTAGLLCQLISSITFGCMAVVVKFAGKAGVPVMEIVLARSLILLAMSSAMLARRGEPQAWPWRSDRRWMLLLRGFFGMGGITCMYWALQLMPLTDVVVLGFLAPVLVAVAAPLLLGEPSSRGVLLALPLCAAGVLLVTQPSFLFGGSGGSVSGAISAKGVAVSISQAISIAGAKLTVRDLGKTEPLASIIFSMAAVSSLGAALLCAVLPHHFSVPTDPHVWALLAAAGGLACVVQVLSTLALKLCRVMPLVLISYCQLVWALLADLLLFHHRPSPLSLVGAVLVCASSLIIAVMEGRKRGGSTNSSTISCTSDTTSGVRGASSNSTQLLAHGSQSQLSDLKAKHSSPVLLAGAAGTPQQQASSANECSTHVGLEMQQKPAVSAAAAAYSAVWDSPAQREQHWQLAAARQSDCRTSDDGDEENERAPLVGGHPMPCSSCL